MSFSANFINHLMILGKDYHKSTAFYGCVTLNFNTKYNHNKPIEYEHFCAKV